MTREEVIAYFKKIVIRIKGIMAEEDEARKDRFSQSLEATEMAVRSLEAWDNVRTEIQDIMIVGQDEERIYQQIKAIIDRYMKESEG